MSAGHGHGSQKGRPTPARALWVAIILNGAFLILEVVIGLWTNSLALLSDAGHMVSDVGALAVALVALRLREREPSDHYTFGLRRAPVLGGLINAITLLIIVAFIGTEAVDRFQDPPNLDAVPVLWTGIAGLFVNLTSAWYLARSEDRSVNTRGAMLHLLADALGSVAAIIAAVGILVWSFPLADPIASVIIGLLILVGTYPLLRDTVRILLQRSPTGTGIVKLRDAIRAIEGVREVRDLHVWELDSGDLILTAVLMLDAPDLETSVRRTEEVRALLKAEFEIEHATLESCPIDLRSDAPNCGGRGGPPSSDRASHSHEHE